MGEGFEFSKRKAVSPRFGERYTYLFKVQNTGILF